MPNQNDLIDTPFFRTHFGASRGHDYIRIFGYNDDVDGAEDIWDAGGDYTYLTSAVTLFVSSSSTSDTHTMHVEGLDANYDHQEVEVTLTGRTQAEVGTGKTWIRVNTAHNNSGTIAIGDIYVAETDNLTNGVPDTFSKIKAKIIIGNEETHMAMWSCPRNHTGVLLNWSIDAAGLGSGWLTGSEAADVALMRREFGKVFRIKERAGLVNKGSTTYAEIFKFGLELHPKSDIKVRALATTANNAQITSSFEIFILHSVETGD